MPSLKYFKKDLHEIKTFSKVFQVVFFFLSKSDGSQGDDVDDLFLSMRRKTTRYTEKKKKQKMMKTHKCK